MNQRRNRRIPLPLTGELAVGGQSHSVEIRDISLSGVRLLGAVPAIRAGTPCFLTLFADEDDRVDAATIYGHIVYCGSDSCAMAFATVDNRDFALLTRWLSRHADEPAALRDEIEHGATPAIAEWKDLDS